MEIETSLFAERAGGPASKVVGLYQMFLRRNLEHFFPDALLELEGDRSFIEVDALTASDRYRIEEEPGGIGVVIQWLRSRYLFLPGSPTPFLPAERRLIDVIVRFLDHRFLALFDPEAAHRAEMFQYAYEDFIVSEYLNPLESVRVPAALEALRVAALSTYENRRVSTGALLLGTDDDPALPGWSNTKGAPKYGVRLTAIKGFHRLCDGVRTVYVVDRHGDLGRAVDIARWADQTQGSSPPASPCPRAYCDHARANPRRRACLPGAHAFAGDQGLRSRQHGVLVQRRPAGGSWTSRPSSRPGARPSAARPASTWPRNSSRPRSTWPRIARGLCSSSSEIPPPRSPN